ncbi:MAG: ATP-dependent Clp protease proteolytic subunit, partial [Armatimonadetes bacterium]|nr:ATP-dependent Clp protease proteolytic subunit [Armatimonadota bacterium]
RTVCTGLCASAAILPFLAAPKERRFSLPHCRFLLHQPMTTVIGVAADIAISASELRRLRERYNSIVAAETGKSLEQVTIDTDRDFWLTAQEALEYGLVGRIIASVHELEGGIS